MRRRLAGAATLWLVLALAEIALIGKLDVQETPVGIGIALLATLVTAGALAVGEGEYELRLSWLWLPLFVARNIARDAIVVYGVVLRRLAGGPVRDVFLELPFDPGGDDAESNARRALAIAGISTSPNEIVLSVDRKRRTMRVHVLVETGARRHSRQWPL